MKVFQFHHQIIPREVLRKVPRFTVYPKSHYVTPREKIVDAIDHIKDELKGRYARPNWLIWAELRLQITENKFILSGAKRFVGIETKADVAEIKPPNIERFNSILQILKDEKRYTEANQLFEAFFA